MTAPTAMTRDRLAAFVDGELSPEEAAAVVMHLADHPADQAYVDDLFAANEALARAFAAPLSEPVPPAIQAVLAEPTTDAAPTPGAAILPFPPARARRLPALAGGLGLAAGLALALYLVQPAPPATLAVGPVDAASPLATALESLPSGSAIAGSGPETLILSTLPTATGPCREVESLDRAARRIDIALACRDPQGLWRIEVVLAETLPSDATPTTAEDGFLAAEGTALQDFSAYLDRRGAGLALSPEEESALIARGWAE